eukprot:CAMPEP_0194267620 /NCGR_PEP_ID=MMETSP0169-20130528/2096_1 /TAXON_ID=218684 /ORGANISM="Corethron pennatum, Strain L29A3" /LENGTH=299 /DNA_ID=CAMNT_0039008533 /DNA_START=67 /DNA_END=967 /DNA_ORIENTATION=-
MTISKCSTKVATFILTLSVSFSMAKYDVFIRKNLRRAQQRLSTAYPNDQLTHPLPGGDEFINLPMEAYTPNSKAPTSTAYPKNNITHPLSAGNEFIELPLETNAPTSTAYPKKPNPGTKINTPTSTACLKNDLTHPLPDGDNSYPKNNIIHPLLAGNEFIELPLKKSPTSTAYPKRPKTGTQTNDPTPMAYLKNDLTHPLSGGDESYAPTYFPTGMYAPGGDESNAPTSTAYPKNALIHSFPVVDEFINLPLETQAPTSTAYPKKLNTDTRKYAPTSTAYPKNDITNSLSGGDESYALT